MKTVRLKFFWLALLLLAFGGFEHAFAQTDFDLVLNPFNLGGVTDSYAPSIDGLFLIPSVTVIDPPNPPFEPPQTAPLTQVSFGIVDPLSSDFAGLSYEVGIDGLSNLTTLGNLSVQESTFTFGNTGLPIYLVTGDLATPVLLNYGNHTIAIVDESRSSSSLVGYSGATAVFEVDEVAAPEPAPIFSGGIALAVMLVLHPLWRRDGNAQL